MGDNGFAAQLAEDLSEEDLRLVLSVFRTDVQRLTDTMAGAATAEDGTAFRRAAHGLAGAAGAVGAARLEAACRAAMAEAGPLGALLAEIRAWGEAALGDVARVMTRLDGRG
jgi:HPt (histidine-containing phosphotransfer) domain-containing protein